MSDTQEDMLRRTVGWLEAELNTERELRAESKAHTNDLHDKLERLTRERDELAEALEEERQHWRNLRDDHAAALRLLSVLQGETKTLADIVATLQAKVKQ